MPTVITFRQSCWETVGKIDAISVGSGDSSECFESVLRVANCSRKWQNYCRDLDLVPSRCKDRRCRLRSGLLQTSLGLKKKYYTKKNELTFLNFFFRKIKSFIFRKSLLVKKKSFFCEGSLSQPTHS